MFNLLTIFIFLFGLIIGSFLNCLIWRLHHKIPLTPFTKGGDKWQRSCCPNCQTQISWYDNIPLVSFIILGGKCRSCGKSISVQYPLVELITGVLFVMAYFLNYELRIMNQGSVIYDSLFMIQLLRDWFLIALMIVIFIYDLRWYLILDVITLPACLIVFLLNLGLGYYSWQNLLISGIIGGSFFFIQFLISRGKWIGGGDIRLGLLIGLALGWPNIAVAIFLGYFIGSIVGLGLIFTGRKQWGSQIPLGVFLSLGTIITLFWGEKILQWYMGMF